MIIYGTNSAHLNTIQSDSATCPNCNTKGSIILSVYRRHAHIFWIPLFPIGKVGASQCQNCKSVLETKEMPEDIKREYDNLKRDSKGPIWQFAGLAIILIFITWVAYANEENKKMELEYLAAPSVGDVYEYKIDKGSYSSFKVVDILSDSLVIAPNEYEINKMEEVDEIDKPENYSEMTYSISKEEVRKMYDSGEIFDINR